MIYKKYGKTGKDISVIGFGGMRFEKTGENYDYDYCAEVVRKANELGVNYFDTAPYYCEDNSELIMGHAFKNMPGEFYVSTKSSTKDGSKLRSQLETSLKRMGLSKINFFHIWCVLNMDDYRSRMVKGGAYEAALNAKEEGLIDHILFSTHCNGDEIETIIKEGYFEGITLGYNILNFPFRQKGLKAAYEHELGVATMNPLSGGLIPQKAQYFDFIRENNDETVVEAALRFNASHKEITTVLAGMGSLEEVIQNTRAGNQIHEFPEGKLNEIESKLFSSMDNLCTGCRYCEHCPKEIEISKYMMSYNQGILGEPADTLKHMDNNWDIPLSKVNECIECGVCESKCTQHLPITMRLKEISKLSKEIKFKFKN
ncbi:MAG: putative oxidoreductase of aldo/keto reductase family [Clostridiales bacterium]|nr:putative oxidoreductase of aldo/keto reductase family [Clostridiales bacterium]